MRVWCLVTLVGVACRSSSGVSIDACKTASKKRAPGALALCRAAYADGNPVAGGLLARELADQGAPLADVKALATAIGDRAGGAEAWNAVGDRLRVDGDARGAVAAYRRAYEHRGLDDRRGRVRDAVGLYNQYSSLDEFRAAMQFASVAYAESAREGDPLLRAYVLTGVAGLLHDMGDLPAAEALVAEADGVVAPGSPFEAHHRQLHGLLHSAHGRYKLARRELARASELAAAQKLVSIEHHAKLSVVGIALAEGDPDTAARVLATDVLTAESPAAWRNHHAYSAARVALARGDHEAAIELTSAALAGEPGGWTESLEAVRGSAHARARRWTEAEQSLLAAIAAIEARRAVVELDALKPWLLQQDLRWPFEDLFLVYVAQGRAADALAVVQRATARSMLDGLLDDRVRVPGSIDAELGRAGDRVDGLRALARSLRSSAPAAPPRASELLAALGARHVLTYFRARDELWLIVAAASTVKLVRVGSVTEMAALADAHTTRPDDPVAASRLADRLLPEVGLPVPGVPLFVVLDEPVHHIPFAALRVNGRFLVERNPIAFVPNAAVLAHLARAPRPVGARVVVGDPGGDLPASREEAAEVGRLVGIAPQIGAAATRERLFAASSSELVHVAAHTRATALGSALVLADGVVSAAEIVDRGIAASVVVLTSCASADPLDREELGPLANAFLAAGSHAVVASRWSVGDEVARDFARRFYAAGGLADPVEATAIAQRKLISAGLPVTSWATFVVLGEGASTIRKGARR